MSEKTNWAQFKADIPDYIDNIVVLESSALDAIDKSICRGLTMMNYQVEVGSSGNSGSAFGFVNGLGALKITLRWMHTEPTVPLLKLLTKIQSSGGAPADLGLESLTVKKYKSNGNAADVTQYQIRGLDKFNSRYNGCYEMRTLRRNMDAAGDALYKSMNENAESRCDFKLWQMRQSAEIRDLLLSIRNNQGKSNFVSATFLCDVIEPQS